MSVYERRTEDSCEAQSEERTELNERDRRALEQYLTVLEDQGRVRGADDLYLVVSQSGKEYLVDACEQTCECPDHEYRDVKCKHIRRVEFATGARTVPESVDVAGKLGEHVSSTPRVAAADGGVTVREAAGDCEVTESNDVWEGPFPEYDKYGNPTGCSYVRCRDCSREVLTGRKDFASHRDGCKFEAEE